MFIQKHTVQQDGCGQITAGLAPAQLADSCTRFKARKAQISAGIVPVSPVKWRKRRSNDNSRPSSVGMGPDSPVPNKESNMSCVNWPTSVGIAPVRSTLLWSVRTSVMAESSVSHGHPTKSSDKDNHSRSSVSRPSSVGRGPLNMLSSMVRKDRSERLPISVGRLPVNWLLSNCKMFSWDISPICGCSCPLSWLVSRSNVMRVVDS